MENTYKVSHTAFPDGSMVKYLNGMKKPETADFSHVIKKALLNAIRQNHKKAVDVIRMNALESGAEQMYAVK